MEYKHFEVVCETKKAPFHGFRHYSSINDIATHIVLHDVVVLHSLFLVLILSF